MSFAQARLSSFPTQSLRGLGAYPTQPLRGLHGLGSVSPESIRNVVSALDNLVNVARSQTTQIVSETRASGFPFIRFWSAKVAQDWADNIVRYVESVRATLTAPSKDGRVFFVAQPDTTAALLEDTKRTLRQMISEFKESARSTSIAATLEQAVQQVSEAVLSAAQAAASGALAAAANFPVGAAIVAATAAAVVWFKFLR